MSRYMNDSSVVRRIQHALKHKQAFSLVRIGDGENIVLAQKSVWPIGKVLREPWAKKSKQGKKGVRLPNIQLRNRIVEALKKATIVGVLSKNDQVIRAPQYLKRSLTDRVFRYYKINPKLTCNACVNRTIAQKRLFMKFLKGTRILVINRHPERMKSILLHNNLTVSATISFSDYRQIDSTLKKVSSIRDKFDIALISCGVNAVILAPRIAKATGKVALDFGKAPFFI